MITLDSPGSPNVITGSLKADKGGTGEGQRKRCDDGNRWATGSMRRTCPAIVGLEMEEGS